jgi:hypothetical protein
LLRRLFWIPAKIERNLQTKIFRLSRPVSVTTIHTTTYYQNGISFFLFLPSIYLPPIYRPIYLPTYLCIYLPTYVSTYLYISNGHKTRPCLVSVAYIFGNKKVEKNLQNKIFRLSRPVSATTIHTTIYYQKGIHFSLAAVYLSIYLSIIYLSIYLPLSTYLYISNGHKTRYCFVLIPL